MTPPSILKHFARLLSLCALISAAPAASILVITNDNGDTQSLVDDLTSNGHTVTRNAHINGAPSAADLTGIDLIIVTRETTSTQYDDGTEPRDWNAIERPLINMAPHIMRNNRWGYVNGTSIPSISPFSSFDSPYLQASHPIVTGLNTTVLNPSTSGTGIGNSLPTSAIQIATADGGASHGIFVIPEGTTLFNNRGTTGAVRIGFIRGDSNSWSNVSANGSQILENMISWSLAISATPPVVTNAPASNIGSTSATLNGEVTDTGGGAPDVTIYYGETNGGTNPSAWANSINLGAQSSTFSGTITGLSPSTTYFFRSFAENLGGEDWANSSATFTTNNPASPPSVVNNPATGIGFTRVDMNGTVTATGGDAPTITIFYGNNDGGTNPSNWDSSTNLGVQSGAFTTSLELLSASTTYYYRAFAQNSGGTAWAPSSESFITNSFALPSIINSPATSITGIAAQINGEVTSTGGDAPSVTFFYGTTDGGTNPNNWENSINVGDQSSTFTAMLSGLSPLTTYYYRTFAQNAAGSVWAASSLSFITLESSDLVINEFMAANDGGETNNPNNWFPIANQIAGTSDDWIEILNTSADTISLDGWSLSDNPLDPQKWLFPSSAQIPAGGFLIVYASNSGVPDANGNLHTNFRLSAGGENLALIRPSGSIASEFATAGDDYPSQSDDISYGVNPTTQEPVFFSEPTPGAPNNMGNIANVADTRFDPDRGYYDTEIDVTITTATESATIYFTTDGSDPVDPNGNPGPTATAYTGPVHIDGITTLRAAATAVGFAPTNIDTHSYILLDIEGAGPNGIDPAGLNTPFLQQTQPAGYGNLTSGDYDMDTSISQQLSNASGHPTSTAQTMLLGMRDIPTISIAMNRDDFVGSNGIYTNSQNKGFAWERACSAEFIPAANGDASPWQENCGIRVQGGASRIPSRSPKHALSFRFRAEYGSGKLREPLFPGNDVEEFNVIALRAGYNNSWVHSDEGQRSRGSLIRDQWMRNTMIDMGNPAGGHGLHAHLFVNGLYWGIFNAAERADNAHYAEHNGGDSDFIDARNGSEFVSGDPIAFNAMTAVVNGGDWDQIQQVLDVDNYIDYQLLNRFGANSDLSAGNNWRGAGGGPFPVGQPELMAPWQPYSWDGERIFEDPANTIVPVDPMGIRNALESNPEYLARFADRVQQHFFNGGSLTPEATQSRWANLAEDIDRAIIAESARWGDHRGGAAYSRDNEWLTEQTRLFDEYFPVRTNNVLNALSTLLPATTAPVYRVDGTPQHGGLIPVGSTLSATSDAGSIYYTSDGSDPRLEGGSVNPAASFLPGGGVLTTLIDLEENGWSYLHSSTALSNSDSVAGTAGFNNNDWKHEDFDDSAWPSGQALLGYGTINTRSLNTPITPVTPRYPTIYLRKNFTVTNAETFTEIELDAVWDDGAIFYLNGREIGRVNMGSGTIQYSDLATSAVSNEGTLVSINTLTLNPGELLEGSNVLAVELHQSNLNSSDTGIDVILRGLQPGAGADVSIPLVNSAVVKSRVFDNGEWSALSEALFIVAPTADSSNIVVSEFMYNPDGTSEDTEFIELMNISPTDIIDLTAFRFEGVEFTFSLGTSLAPGERIVIVRNRDAFEAAYDTTGMNIAEGDFDSSLSNDGEELALLSSFGIDAQRFIYNDVAPWPTAADGDGFSLVLISPTSSPDHSDPNSWRASAEIGGNPGGTDASTFTGDPEADNDSDGLSAFLEFALGSILGDTGVSPESYPTAGSTLFEGVEYLTITYRRNLLADGVIITSEVSTDLQDWDPLGTILVSATANGDGTQTVTERSLIPLASIPREFIRLNITSAQ